MQESTSDPLDVNKRQTNGGQYDKALLLMVESGINWKNRQKQKNNYSWLWNLENLNN